MNIMNIEEKTLRALAVAMDDLLFTFQLIKNPTNTTKKDSYELYIEVPVKQEQFTKYRLITTQNKDIRPFKDLDFGKKFIQKLSPKTKRFSVVID
jgi:hypothetical protein